MLISVYHNYKSDIDDCILQSAEVTPENVVIAFLENQGNWDLLLTEMVKNPRIQKQLNSLGFYKKEQVLDAELYITPNNILTKNQYGLIENIPYYVYGNETFYVQIDEKAFEKIAPEKYQEFKKIKNKKLKEDKAKQKKKDEAKVRRKAREVSKAQALLAKEGLLKK